MIIHTISVGKKVTKTVDSDKKKEKKVDDSRVQHAHPFQTVEESSVDSGAQGFERGLKPERILGATDAKNKQLMFLMKVGDFIASIISRAFSGRAAPSRISCPRPRRTSYVRR